MIGEIKNLAQLRAERLRIQEEMDITVQMIKNDIEDIKSSFNPIKVVTGFVKNMLFNQHSGLMHDSVRTMIGNFSYNKLLGFLPWPMRMAASYLLKNVVSNFIQDKKGTIIEKAISIVGSLKNMVKNNSTKTAPSDLAMAH